MGECFFWYRPTRVVPDQRPLNGRCCCCCLRVNLYNFSAHFKRSLITHLLGSTAMYGVRCGVLLLMFCGLSVSSVCLCSLAQPQALQKWMNRLRCCLGCEFAGTEEPCSRWRGQKLPRGQGTFGGHSCTCPDLPAVDILNDIRQGSSPMLPLLTVL